MHVRVLAGRKEGSAYFIVLINKVEATVARHEGGDLLAVLDQLHTKGGEEKERRKQNIQKVLFQHRFPPPPARRATGRHWPYRMHLRMAELGCFASTPLHRRTNARTQTNKMKV